MLIVSRSEVKDGVAQARLAARECLWQTTARPYLKIGLYASVRFASISDDLTYMELGGRLHLCLWLYARVPNIGAFFRIALAADETTRITKTSATDTHHVIATFAS